MAAASEQNTTQKAEQKAKTGRGKTGREKARRRERPLGAAVGWALAVTLGIGLAMLTIRLLIPNSAWHNLFSLVLNTSSATTRGSDLFQTYAEQVQREDDLIATPLMLLCGGLTLGWLAPSYSSVRRVLQAAAWMGFGVVAVSQAFLWPTAVIQQNRLNAHEGGEISRMVFPPDLIARQLGFCVFWIALCIGGAWLAQCWRHRPVRSR